MWRAEVWVEMSKAVSEGDDKKAAGAKVKEKQKWGI